MNSELISKQTVICSLECQRDIDCDCKNITITIYYYIATNNNIFIDKGQIEFKAKRNLKNDICSNFDQIHYFLEFMKKLDLDYMVTYLINGSTFFYSIIIPFLFQAGHSNEMLGMGNNRKFVDFESYINGANTQYKFSNRGEVEVENICKFYIGIFNKNKEVV